jgi:hypothetical protein
MSQILKTMLVPEPDGSGAIFNDITGNTGNGSYSQSGSLNYSDVAAIGLRIATYTTLSGLATLKAGEKFTRYKEYVKTLGGTSTIDSKTLVTGTFFVPRLENIVVPTGDEWQETGYYVYPYLSTWLPTSSQTQNNISLDKLNQLGDNIYDDIYAYTYEIYQTNSTTTGTISSVSGAKYLVTSGTVTYNGSTYYPGDTFIPSFDGYSIVVTAGHCYQMYASTDAYSVLDYNTRQNLYQLIMEKSGTNCITCWTQLSKLVTQLEAIGFMAFTGDVALGPASETLIWVNDGITNFQSCNC